MFILLELEGYCTFRSMNYNSYYFLNTYENSHTFESQNITFTGTECIKWLLWKIEGHVCVCWGGGGVRSHMYLNL